MTNDKPLVSIGIPVYNGYSCLKRELDSILNQTYKNIEIIISDNDSQDKTGDLCAHFAKKDTRIKYYRQRKNIGAIKNFNFVFEKARGKYFMWGASDDVHLPEFLEKCVTALEKNNKAVLAFTKYRIVDEKGNILKKFYPEKYFPFGISPYARGKDLLNKYIHEGKPILMYGVWRRCLIDKGLTPNFQSADSNFVFRNALKGDFIFIDKELFVKIEDPKKPDQKIFALSFMRLIFFAFLRKIDLIVTGHFFYYIKDIIESGNLTIKEKFALIKNVIKIIFRLFYVLQN